TRVNIPNIVVKAMSTRSGRVLHGLAHKDPIYLRSARVERAPVADGWWRIGYLAIARTTMRHSLIETEFEADFHVHPIRGTICGRPITTLPFFPEIVKVHKQINVISVQVVEFIYLPVSRIFDKVLKWSDDVITTVPVCIGFQPI